MSDFRDPENVAMEADEMRPRRCGQCGLLKDRVQHGDELCECRTAFMIRRKDSGDYWHAGSPFRPGSECWARKHFGTRYDAMSIAIAVAMRFGPCSFETEIVPV